MKRNTEYLTQACKNIINNVLQSDYCISFAATPASTVTPTPMATPPPTANPVVIETLELAAASVFLGKRCSSFVADLTQFDTGERRATQIKMGKMYKLQRLQEVKI